MLCLFGLELKKMDRLTSVLPNGSFVCHSAKGVARDKWVHCLIKKVAIHPYMCSGELYLLRGGFPARWLTGQPDQLLRLIAMWCSNWETTEDCIFFLTKRKQFSMNECQESLDIATFSCGQRVFLFIYWTSQKTWHGKDILLKKKLEQGFPRKDVTFPADPE